VQSWQDEASPRVVTPPATRPLSPAAAAGPAKDAGGLQTSLGNRAAADERARMEAEMDVDVEVIARRLKEQVLTASEEREVLAVIRRWAGTPSFDRFVTKMKIRAIRRATLRSAFMDTTVNLFDTLFHEMEDDRLVELERLLATSTRYQGAKAESEPSENVWATVGRQELIGLFGMMKGLSAGLASVGDVGAWAAVRAADAYLAPYGIRLKDPPSFATWVQKQLDVSGDFLFDGGFTGGEELFLGQNAAAIGKAGGSIVWNLVMLHGSTGAGSVGRSARAGALAAHDVVAAFKGVDDALDSMGDYLLRMQAAGTLTREHLLGDDEFKVEAFKLAGALTGAVASALGVGGDSMAQALQTAMKKLGTVFKAGEIGAKVGEISQLLMDDALAPAERRAAVGRLVMELVADSFTLTAARAARVDADRASRSLQRAFAGCFAQDEALRAVWAEAAKGADDFPKARATFWRLVNEGSGGNVDRVRRMLDAAGYDLQGGDRAPVLRMSGWDARASRERSDRLLTIDHAAAQSRAAGKGQLLDPGTLRFMSGRDNAVRGNRYEPDDVPLQGWEAYHKDRQRPDPAREAWEAALRERVNAFKERR
jgi:hypothetical protein